MELIIDLGNTNQKAAVFGEGKLLELFRFPHLGLREIRTVTGKYTGIDQIILSSVVEHSPELISYLGKMAPLLVLDEDTPLPLINQYRSKKTLGKDRIAAAVAGHLTYPGENVLVVNSGTCITYDFVNAGGEYLGGAISPGIMMRFRALHTFTGKLPLIEISEEVDLTGTDTEGSILSGVLNGALAEIEGFTGRYMEIYPRLRVILSGGDVNYFDKRLKVSTFAVPNIVIHGLQQILAFNVSKTN